VKKIRLIFHPFLFAIFPVLFLFAQNIEQLSLSQLIAPAAAVLLASLILWLLFRLAIRDTAKSGMATALFLTLFFSYIPNYLKVYGARVGPLVTGNHYFLIPTWIAVLGYGLYRIIRIRGSTDTITKLLHIVSAALVALPLINGAHYYIQKNSHLAIQGNGLVKAQNSAADTDSYPHIYYIILDGYARADILKNIYGYDNTPFIDYLTRRGFYLAGAGQANYGQTALSLASSLNLNYLQELIAPNSCQSKDRRILKRLLADNAAVRYLRGRGYSFVTFASGYSFTDFTNADEYLTPYLFLDEFGTALLNATPAPYLAAWLALKVPLFTAVFHPCDIYRRRIRYTLQHLPEPGRSQHPVFVFAHLTVPHPPFVFGRINSEINLEREFTLSDGSHLYDLGLTKEQYIDYYLRQVDFVNNNIKESLDGIIAQSARPSIIILQSDHGPGSQLDNENADKTNLPERLSILQAYYFPGGDYTGLYPSITPVNSFRFVFNRFLGASYELKPDAVYYSTWSHPYNFINLIERVDSK
jgi:hypothetical protein